MARSTAFITLEGMQKSSNREVINQQLSTLSYDPKTVMVFNGTGYTNGVKRTRSINWGGNGHDVTVPYATTIPLHGNARNLSIKAEGRTCLA
jgi:hypothetical protein